MSRTVHANRLGEPGQDVRDLYIGLSKVREGDTSLAFAAYLCMAAAGSPQQEPCQLGLSRSERLAENFEEAVASRFVDMACALGGFTGVRRGERPRWGDCPARSP
ncbi:hypothetical protein MRX96_047957 [Rhipicephalus microplus]